MERLFSILALCFAFVSLTVSAENGYDGRIRHIDIINWTHTDYGFTDHPLILFELQKRYIDIAIDYAEQSADNAPGERFTWTVEALDPLWRWWKEADEARRKKFLKAVDRGQIDVNIMPFNIHPCYNEDEIGQLLDWVPEELKKKLSIGIAIQNDVNGFPRAIARRLPEMGVDYIWLGMNGHHPFPIPTLSKWELGDGKYVWLWNGGAYWDAYDYFSQSKWRTWQCEANDLMYRWPREGEIFASDDEAVLKAHEICVKKLAALEKKGYSYSVLPVTFSNQWRCDNDGPFFGIVEFVKTWNKMGLQPELRLSTATASIRELVQNNEPSGTVQGEFGDWWAFGLAALPREHAAARSARYLLAASMSDVLGKPSDRNVRETEDVMRDVCTFYEHTFASMAASSAPYEFFNQGTITECSRYAYKAYEFAKWRLAQRVRTRVADEDAGLYVFNTQDAPYSGWIEFDFISLRNREAVGVRNVATGKEYEILKTRTSGRFWADELPPESVTRYVLVDTLVNTCSAGEVPDVVLDGSGWPVSVTWKGMEYPLYEGEIGLLRSCSMVSGGWWSGNAELEEHFSGRTQAVREDTPYSVRFTQKMENALVNSAIRFIEIYKKEPRVHVKVIYDRKLHPQRVSEVHYVEFPLPDIVREIKTSNGGSVFTPFKDNIDNTCKSFYVTDAWVSYGSSDGTRVWSSATTPIVTFGNTEYYKNPESLQNSNRLLSMVYNNGWGTNFPMEYSGDVVCEYDLYWYPGEFDKEAVGAVTDTYLVKPVVVMNPAAREDISYRKWLNGEQID